jgi:hypothetical protein
MNDQQVAEGIRADLDHVLQNSDRVEEPPMMAEFVYAIREIGLNSAALAGDGHVPVPEKGGTSAIDYVKLVASVILVNVRVFVNRPHDPLDSEQLLQVALSVHELRVGVDLAA